MNKWIVARDENTSRGAGFDSWCGLKVFFCDFISQLLSEACWKMKKKNDHPKVSKFPLIKLPVSFLTSQQSFLSCTYAHGHRENKTKATHASWLNQHCSCHSESKSIARFSISRFGVVTNFTDFNHSKSRAYATRRYRASIMHNSSRWTQTQS